MHDLFTVLALGFFLGMRHATDPDHVIAVTTIVARQRRAGIAAAVGALWGLGHTLTILLVGGGIILFRWVIPPLVGLSMEFAVSLMLILLGLMNLTGLWRRRSGELAGGVVHAHPHPHGDYVHDHAHGHAPEAHPHDPTRTPVSRMDRWFGGLDAWHWVRPLAVGVVHGLAGSAAVALLVLATISDPRWALFYLLVFGLGTVAGMTILTATMAWPMAAAGDRSARWSHGLRVASGVVSLVFGVFLMYQVGITQGLLTGRPTWTPH